ncbi:hypothetical protein QVD17_39264 [Tagetes erecta]|uniref:Replication factor A C-terminal domain-containing protein n=1 Tax=Tagetes erecta TaxID=13708 RepID=A0AAD8NGY1_TARER|nr:hypothetical protein QVD17_39264 [Tagetes erecta]
MKGASESVRGSEVFGCSTTSERIKGEGSEWFNDLVERFRWRRPNEGDEDATRKKGVWCSLGLVFLHSLYYLLISSFVPDLASSLVPLYYWRLLLLMEPSDGCFNSATTSFDPPVVTAQQSSYRSTMLRSAAVIQGTNPTNRQVGRRSKRRRDALVPSTSASTCAMSFTSSFQTPLQLLHRALIQHSCATSSSDFEYTHALVGPVSRQSQCVNYDYIDLGNCTEMKVRSFIKYLKTSKPFGDTTAELYTIEFQKRVAASGMLRPEGSTKPLEIRVIRRWNPPFRDNETCFLLVDKHCQGVQAIVKGKDQRYVEARLLPNTCYRLRGYACTAPDPYVNTLTHPTTLQIGAASTFEPIPDNEEFPRTYLEISSRQIMQQLCDRDTEVVDYIGLLQRVEDKLTRAGRPYVSLLLTDTSNQNIEVALWAEIANSPDRFNRAAVENATQPAVVAITAAKVKLIMRELQLWSTRASYVYLNPRTAETEILIDRFNREEEQEETSGIQSTLRNKAIPIITENPTTIGDLTIKEPHELTGRTYTISGVVIHIASDKKWAHNICPICGNPIFKALDEWYCPSDSFQPSANHIYRITATIGDETGTMDATIFDDAAQAMVGISCAELLMQSSNVDLPTIPEALAKIIGQPTKFSTQVQKNNRTSALHGTIKRVTMPVTQSFTRTPATPMPVTSQTTTTQTGSPSRSSAKRPLNFNQVTDASISMTTPTSPIQPTTPSNSVKQGGSKTSTSNTTVSTSPTSPAPTKQPPHNNEGIVAAKSKKKRSE